jgi:hypothetical protein
MIRKNFGIPLYLFDNLSAYTNLKHYVSSREGGVSTGEIGALNLSYKVGDKKENVIANRKKIAEALSISPDRLIFPDQTHSSNTKIITTGEEDLSDTDALITDKKNICISVMSADCVPVLLYDPSNKIIGAIHAGWKGTVARIVNKTVTLMQKEFGVSASDLIAGIGPSICQKVYEVGPEVIAEMERAFGTRDGLVERINEEGKGFINLWEANKKALLESGVRKKNIEVAEICTYTNHDLFFSARHSGNKAGRFAAGIMLI